MDGGNPPADSGTPPVDAGPTTGPVTGVHWIHHETDTGTVSLPFNEAFGLPAIGLWDGGTFTVVNAQALADGGFFFPSAPDGEFLLNVGSFANLYPLYPFSVWTVTSSRFLDLSEYVAGRPNINLADGGQSLQVVLSGLAPWDPQNDQLLLTSLGGEHDSNLFLTAAAGATTDNEVLQDSSYDPNGTTDWGGLIDSSQGDITYVSQMHTVNGDGGAFVSSVTSGAVVTSFTQPPVSNGVLLATMVSTPMQSVHVPLHAGQFSALVSQVPGAIDTGPGLGIAATLGDVYSYQYVSLLTALLAPTTSDAVVEASFYDPVPSGPQSAWAYEQFNVNYVIANPDGGAPWTRQESGSASFVYGPPVTFFDAGVIGPVLSPPTQLTVNGQLSTPQSAVLHGVGQTPVLAWQAPALGTPTYYHVRVRVLLVNANSTGVFGQTLAAFYTPHTTLHVPPGIIRAGLPHVVTVEAEYGPGDSLARPFQFGGSGSGAYSDTFSGILYP